MVADKAEAPTPLKHIYPEVNNLPREFTKHYQTSSSQKPLKSFITWNPTWSPEKDKWLKLPFPHVNKTEQHMTLPEVMRTLEPNKGLGLVFNSSHTYIALDIDNIPLENDDLFSLLSNNPTYIEASPSGAAKDRYRALYMFKSHDDKEQLRSHPVHKYNGDGDDKADLELFNTAGYCTLTGVALKDHQYYSDEISTITAATLIELWPKWATHTPVPDNVEPHLMSHTGGNVTKAEIWLKHVSLDPSDPGCQILMDKLGHTHREYWYTGLMAIHAAHGPLQGLLVGEAWSKSDPDNYDADAFTATWSSISPDSGGITVATYELYYKQFMPDWPVRNSTGGIIHAEYENFRFFLEFLGLEIMFDNLTQSIFFEGPQSVLYPNLYENEDTRLSCSSADIPRLEAQLLNMTRLYKFRPRIGDLQSHLQTLIASIPPKNKVNRFAQEISLVEWDGIDRIKTMAEKIIIKDPQKMYPEQWFHETLIRKWLYTICRYYWPDEMAPAHLGSTAEGMLILSSEQGGIGKSHFTYSLFPGKWSHLQITQEPRFSRMNEDKDYLMKVCVCAVNNLDEAENAFANNNESSLKQYMTCRTDSFRAPYGRNIHFYPRMHALYASTNKTSLPIPTDGGHRRYWWLNVSYVDTYKLDAMDHMQLWAQVKKELTDASLDNTKRDAPWILTKEERDYLGGYILEHRITNSNTELLHDIYESEAAGFEKRIEYNKQQGFNAIQGTFTASQVATELGMPGANKGLRNTLLDFLKECCPHTIHLNRATIINGLYITGRQTRYFMPMKRTPFDPESLLEED